MHTVRSPYEDLPPNAFWKTGVSDKTLDTISALYTKRYEISTDLRIATAGSCFAQHIAYNMRKRGFSVVDAEPAPPALDNATAQRFGFNLYSARYGNIYTTRQMLQLAKECYGRFQPAEPVWEKDGRYYDALRPSVEPGGLASPDLVNAHRADHLRRVRGVLETANVFVFTFGLTEAWIHTQSGTVYPTAPGTICGRFDPDAYSFKNFSFNEVLGDFVQFREIVRRKNPDCKFLVTVSPVPLTATASGQHVLSATIYSKSVLRAVAGQLYNDYDDVDYFPSYEIISSSFSGGRLYDENLRTVRPAGVDTVMRIFFNEHMVEGGDQPDGSNVRQKVRADRKASHSDVVCEEALLEAFSK